MAVTDSAPDTTTVARLLDADPDNLRLFLEHHPNPSVDVVVSAAVVGRDCPGCPSGVTAVIHL